MEPSKAPRLIPAEPPTANLTELLERMRLRLHVNEPLRALGGGAPIPTTFYLPSNSACVDTLMRLTPGNFFQQLALSSMGPDACELLVNWDRIADPAKEALLERHVLAMLDLLLELTGLGMIQREVGGEATVLLAMTRPKNENGDEDAGPVAGFGDVLVFPFRQSFVSADLDLLAAAAGVYLKLYSQ